jgi:hypothetical protein
MTPTRRGFMRASAAVAGTAVLGTTATTVTAGHGDALPEHVTLSFPRDEMEAYRPLLAVPSTQEFSSPTFYGWKASSPEYDTDAYVYFAYYRGQRGWTRADSHRGDREPLYVFVDSYGTVAEVVYSGWHWMRASSTSPTLYEPQSGEQHPTARTYAPHHQYTLTDTASGRLFPVEPLGTSDGAPFVADETSDVRFEQWLAQGWEEALHPGAAQQPWVMRSRDSWWRDGTERSARFVWNLQLQFAQFGIESLAGEAANTDLANQ